MAQAIAVAMSGGVDSSVAALRLALGGSARCAGGSFVVRGALASAGIERARRLCARLGIPHYLVDARDGFHSAVIRDFAETYEMGRTPNPCVRCNSRIKFGLFAQELRSRMIADGICGEGQEEFSFATGHYARLAVVNGSPMILRARDRWKDQSYMLYRLDREQLARTIFPLGEFLKNEVREIARREGLEAADAEESQDACFLEGTYVDFLAREIPRSAPFERGEIRDMAGELRGYHGGYIRYTVGQRQGLGLGSGPWYVARIDASSNTVIVGRREEVLRSRFGLSDTRWFIDPPGQGVSCSVQVRYRSHPVTCMVEGGEGSFLVVLSSPDLITPGQSAVFYDGELLLGGGIITGF